ncbi:MAG: hypothetical protein ACREB9_02900, partial [Thermoplasmata archaeon]
MLDVLVGVGFKAELTQPCPAEAAGLGDRKADLRLPVPRLDRVRVTDVVRRSLPSVGILPPD